MKLPFLSIFAVTFALLVDEIMLSAVFHVLLGAGNTVAAISIALVGLSASGIAAYAIPAFHEPDRLRALYPSLLFWFCLSLMASAFLIMRAPISHGEFSYAGGVLSVRIWRFVVLNIAAIPFFVGGLTINALLRGHTDSVSRLYACDLIGAALGCLASPFLLFALGAPRAIVYGTAPALLLALWFSFRGQGVHRAWVALPLALLAFDAVGPGIGSFRILNTMGEVSAPQYRSFPVEGSDIDFERWALDAWTIVRGDHIPQQWENFEGWGLSSKYEGPIPRIIQINYNARFSTYVTESDGNLAPLSEWLDADLTALHFFLGRQYDSVLNIGAGGGREVLNALHHGAQHVVAVDISSVVVDDLMKGALSEFSGGLYNDPRVTAVADEGRSFAERSQETFDLIDFSIVGGANLEKMDLVRVDDLFTREALLTYANRLGDDGVFSYVMYSTRSEILETQAHRELVESQPYIPALRTLAGVRFAYEELNPSIRFGDHVLIAALPEYISPTYDLVHIVASKKPFSEDEKGRFLRRSEELDFAVIYPPKSGEGGSDLYTQVIEAVPFDTFADALSFSVRPATDDRPFQYAFDGVHLRRAFEAGTLLRVLSDDPIFSLGLSVGGLAVALTLIPLALMAAGKKQALRGLRKSWSLLLFFGCIGFGFMAVETAALLRLQSFLGKPIYGLSVALFAFLFSSGLGSAFTNRFHEEELTRRVVQIIAALTVVGLIFYWGSEPLFSATVSFPLVARIAIAIAAIFPLAFLMGMLFPIGITLIAAEDPDLIPWAWAMNGCMSVIGTFGTRTIALFLGFSQALLLGLLVYILVAGCALAYARVRSRAAGGS